jgi:hypothetical protein
MPWHIEIGHWILACEEAIQLSYVDGSTRGLCLKQEQESRHMTYTEVGATQNLTNQTNMNLLILGSNVTFNLWVFHIQTSQVQWFLVSR